MLEKLKLRSTKIKLALAGLLASIALIFMIFKRKSSGDLGEYLTEEDRIKEDAKRKLDLETKKLKEEQEEKLRAEAEDRFERLLAAKRAAEKDKKRLEELEKTDNEAFKKEMERRLGVVEKKKG